MTFEIGTRVMTPDGPGVVEFITKRGMPKMGYTVLLDQGLPFDDNYTTRVHYGHDEVKLHDPSPVPGV